MEPSRRCGREGNFFDIGPLKWIFHKSATFAGIADLAGKAAKEAELKEMEEQIRHLWLK